jgi:chemotaxis protein histidine kinase CheA
VCLLLRYFLAPQASKVVAAPKVDTGAAKRKQQEEAQRATAEQKRKDAVEKRAQAAAIAELSRKDAQDQDRKAAAAAKQNRKEAEKENRAQAAAAAEQMRKVALEKRAKATAEAEQGRKEAEEKRAQAAAAGGQKQREAEEMRSQAAAARAQAAEQKRKEAEEKKVASMAAAEQRRRVAEEKIAVAAEQKRQAAIQAAPQAPRTPKTLKAPRGVPSIMSWKKRRDGKCGVARVVITDQNEYLTIILYFMKTGGVTGRIYGSPNFSDGDFVETSPITTGTLESGNVVQTSSGSRYFLSPEAAVKQANIMAAIKDLSSAKPGSTITLTQERKEREAKAAIESIQKATPRATFSLFGLGVGAKEEGLPAASKPTQKPVKVAPRGVPTFTRWSKNRDGSITGIISGSKAFTDGDRVTTSPIAKGNCEKFQIVTTGSGSRYFLS